MGRRVLLVGATGTFGARLAALLARRPGLDLVLAARGLEALEALRGALLASGAVAQLSVRRFDRLQPEKLGELEPWLVVDAAGPFQGDDYALAFAAVRCGAHYVDLADTRGFVAGFTEALDVEARAAGVLAVTGASSTPALSQAVLEPLVRDWRQLDEVVVAISPGARAPRGLSVMQAILSYAGQPVRVFRQGNWRTVRGWSGLRPLDMPGLGRRLASICETPDLDLLPRRFPIRGDALFMAGLELTPMHLGLTLLSLPVRWGLLKSLRPLARPLRRVADLLAPFGSDKGGMIVEATGLDEKGRRIRARWALCAEANAGPSTPAAPAAALVNALLDEAEWEPGARACVGLLSPVQILGELDHLPIHTRVQESHVGDPVLFRRLLGRWMDAAPLSIRTVHGAGAAAFRGRATARAGRSLVARALRRIVGLPGAGRHEVEVSFTSDARGETWSRRFGAAHFSSRLSDTSRLGVFSEGFGPLRFVFDLQPGMKGVTWRQIGWSVAGIPMPAWLGAQVRAAAEDAAGLYRFRVVVAHPWFGLLFAYRGVLSVS